MLNRPVEEVFAFFIALIPAFTVHEFAHAYVAYRLGDPTAKNLGRLTLNPLKHLDLLGTLLVLAAGFGWAKPVPVNPYNLRHGRRDMALVAAVGPLSNLAMAVVVALVWRATGYVGGGLATGLLLVFVYLNITLLFFNLIPVPPLDGFRVLLGVLPAPLALRWERVAQYGPLILFGLFMFGSVFSQYNILGQLITVPSQALTKLLLQG